eukprot:1070235-Rhodomonas_salina.1
MRASKHLVTLDQQPASLMASELWDPAIADQLLQHHYWIPIELSMQMKQRTESTTLWKFLLAALQE